MTGLVLMGVKNLFTLELEDGRRVLASLKGKVLKDIQGHYNSLAPGDWVEAAADPHDAGRAQILGMLPRRSAFARYNEKGRAPQVLAANVDRVLLVTSPDQPPFRPRFIDRVQVACSAQDLEFCILVNKSDLGVGREVLDRLEPYRTMGMRVLRASAAERKGLKELRRLLSHGLTVLTGQSGVGKSSLLNAIEPSLGLRVGELCAKYGRGAHTTVLSILLRLEGDGMVVDTPGFRRFALRGLDHARLTACMPDLAAAAADCIHGQACSHAGEAGCAVVQAARDGLVHPDRYESYLRILEELRRGAVEEVLRRDVQAGKPTTGRTARHGSSAHRLSGHRIDWAEEGWDEE